MASAAAQHAQSLHLALYAPSLVHTLLAAPKKDALRPCMLCCIYDQMKAALVPCVLYQMCNCIVDLICLHVQHTLIRESQHPGTAQNDVTACSPSKS